MPPQDACVRARPGSTSRAGVRPSPAPRRLACPPPRVAVGRVTAALTPQATSLPSAATADGATPGRSASEGRLRCADLSLALSCGWPGGSRRLSWAGGPRVLAVGSRRTVTLSSRRGCVDALICRACAGGGRGHRWGGLPDGGLPHSPAGASVGPAGGPPCCLPDLERQAPGKAVGGGAPFGSASPRSTSPERPFSPALSSWTPRARSIGTARPWMRTRSGSTARAKRPVTAPRTGPRTTRRTAAGPRLVSCPRAAATRPLRRADPAGFFHGRRVPGACWR